MVVMTRPADGVVGLRRFLASTVRPSPRRSRETGRHCGYTA